MGCTEKVRCTCICNVGGNHDKMQKAALIGGGVLLVGGAIGVTVLTGGGPMLFLVEFLCLAAGPVVFVGAGMVAGAGVGAAVHGTVATYKGLLFYRSLLTIFRRESRCKRSCP